MSHHYQYKFFILISMQFKTVLLSHFYSQYLFDHIIKGRSTDPVIRVLLVWLYQNWKLKHSPNKQDKWLLQMWITYGNQLYCIPKSSIKQPEKQDVWWRKEIQLTTGSCRHFSPSNHSHMLLSSSPETEGWLQPVLFPLIICSWCFAETLSTYQFKTSSETCRGCVLKLYDFQEHCCVHPQRVKQQWTVKERIKKQLEWVWCKLQMQLWTWRKLV